MEERAVMMTDATIEVEALTMLLTSEFALMTDHELDCAIGAAIVDGDRDQEAKLKDARALRRTAADDEQLAARERERRARAADEAERVALLDTLTAQLADLEAQYRVDRDELWRVRGSGAAYAATLRAYLSGRDAYSLTSELHGITGDPKFYRPWRVTEEVAMDGGEQFITAIHQSHPPTPQRWRQDAERLRARWPIRSRIGNGG